jgi:hypothetical protein
VSQLLREHACYVNIVNVHLAVALESERCRFRWVEAEGPELSLIVRLNHDVLKDWHYPHVIRGDSLDSDRDIEGRSHYQLLLLREPWEGRVKLDDLRDHGEGPGDHMILVVKREVLR